MEEVGHARVCVCYLHILHYIDIVDNKVHYAYLVFINNILCSQQL